MLYCPSCCNECQEGSNFCSACGHNVEGKQLELNNTFKRIPKFEWWPIDWFRSILTASSIGVVLYYIGYIYYVSFCLTASIPYRGFTFHVNEFYTEILLIFVLVVIFYILVLPGLLIILMIHEHISDNVFTKLAKFKYCFLIIFISISILLIFYFIYAPIAINIINNYFTHTLIILFILLLFLILIIYLSYYILFIDSIIRKFWEDKEDNKPLKTMSEFFVTKSSKKFVLFLMMCIILFMIPSIILANALGDLQAKESIKGNLHNGIVLELFFDESSTYKNISGEPLILIMYQDEKYIVAKRNNSNIIYIIPESRVKLAAIERANKFSFIDEAIALGKTWLPT